MPATPSLDVASSSAPDTPKPDVDASPVLAGLLPELDPLPELEPAPESSPEPPLPELEPLFGAPPAVSTGGCTFELEQATVQALMMAKAAMQTSMRMEAPKLPSIAQRRGRYDRSPTISTFAKGVAPQQGSTPTANPRARSVVTIVSMLRV